MINKKAVEIIRSFEGFRANAYSDPRCKWEVPTIGYGTTVYPDGSHVKKGDHISESRAIECMEHYLEHHCLPWLERIPTWASMNQNQQAALFSFSYNLGPSFYRKNSFKSITSVCDSVDRWDDHEWIREQFIKYRNPGTSVEAGLLRRREAEAKLFCMKPE